jgi:hypothetical protein
VCPLTHAQSSTLPDSCGLPRQDAFGKANLRKLKVRLKERYDESQKMGRKSASGAILPVVDCCRDYTQPSEFAQLLHDDLMKAISRDYGQATFRPKSVLDAEFVAHVAYAKPLVRVYAGQRGVFDAIEKYSVNGFFTPETRADAKSRAVAADDDDVYIVGGVSASSPTEARASPERVSFSPSGDDGADTDKARIPLCLLGAAGGGKSAAIARWLLQHKRPGFVFVHFIVCRFDALQFVVSRSMF